MKISIVSPEFRLNRVARSRKRVRWVEERDPHSNSEVGTPTVESVPSHRSFKPILNVIYFFLGDDGFATRCC